MKLVEKAEGVGVVSIDNDYLKQVKELYLAGLGVGKIAKEIHIRSQAISTCLHSMGFKPRNKLRKKLDLNLIKSLYIDKKLTTQEIADQFHCSKTAICYRLHRMGCVRTNSEAVKLAYSFGRINKRVVRETICVVAICAFGNLSATLLTRLAMSLNIALFGKKLITDLCLKTGLCIISTVSRLITDLIIWLLILKVNTIG